MSGQVTVTEDEFGYVDQPNGSKELVKRFTFCNKNGVTIQVSFDNSDIYRISFFGEEIVDFLLTIYANCSMK